jgi:hypothetical protein
MCTAGANATHVRENENVQTDFAEILARKAFVETKFLYTSFVKIRVETSIFVSITFSSYFIAFKSRKSFYSEFIKRGLTCARTR